MAETPVATQLQALLDRANAAIAGRETWNREKLEILRRDLVAAVTQARADHRGEVTARMVLDDLCVGIDRGVANLAGLAAAARRTAKLPIGETAQ